MTIQEAKNALDDCNYAPSESGEILNELSRSIANRAGVSGHIDIVLFDRSPNSPEIYGATESIKENGWWLDVTGSLPAGLDEESRETWADFEPSGTYYGETVRAAVTEFFFALEAIDY